MQLSSKFIYAIAFQIGWFMCILMGSWISVGYSIAFFCLHFWFLKRTAKRILFKQESLWIVLVFIFGFILETISFSAGFLYTNEPQNLFEHLILPPVWLLSLWMLFAIALRTCLSFTFYRPTLTYLIASIAIPINYYAGAKLNGVVAVNTPYTLSLALITLLWIILLWLLIHIKRHYFEDIFNAD